MRYRDYDWLWWTLGVIAVILFFVGAIAYTKFQWTECRKDPDHTFWHCVQVMD